MSSNSTINKSKKELYFTKLSDKATTPTRGSKFAAGYDLYAAQDFVIKPQERAIVSTDIAVDVPWKTYGRIAPRSGLAIESCIDVSAGVIDKDYRGPLGIVLCNNGKQTYYGKIGDRVAQLICEKIVNPKLVQVDRLARTIRGQKGFGSTGNN